ncbi:MAG: alpha-1,6-mannanase [Bacteroidaceae bacterium]|nr:alpha-1,6-mannanase [Bacteroidaceae bacterium]
MKRIALTVSCLLFALILSAQHAQLTEKEAIQWADKLDKALIKNFWGASFKNTPDRYFFNKMSQQADMSTGDYWPQAHAADVLTDAFVRTGKKKFSRLYELWWQGMPRFNFDAQRGARRGDYWWNAYVDDMEWHCLALIRIYEATGEVRYLNKARQMYADWIWTQWSPESEEPWHGGITWKTDIAPSKNACSNGPAAIIAARLAQFAHIDASYEKNKTALEYQDEANKIYQWERKHLWNAENGAIYDNMDLEGKLGRFSLSYNQGTFIGAAVELYRLTGLQSLLDDAILTARYTTGQMSRRNNGVLPDATEGDGGLFHGIFFRYLANLIVLPDLNDAVRRELTDYLRQSATVMTRQGINPRTHLYGGRWRQPQPSEQPSALTPQLTACMLLEAVCKVNRETATSRNR